MTAEQKETLQQQLKAYKETYHKKNALYDQAIEEALRKVWENFKYMKNNIFTLLLLCTLPVLAQQEDMKQDRAAQRAECAAYWGRFFSVG